MNPFSLGMSLPWLLYLASVAIASLLAAGAALSLVRLWRAAPLPLQHAMLVSALAVAMGSPLLLALLASSGISMIHWPASNGAPIESDAQLSAADAPLNLASAPLIPTGQIALPAAPAVDKPTSNRVAPAPIAAGNGSQSTFLKSFDWSSKTAGELLVLLWGIGSVVSLAQLGWGLARVRKLKQSCHAISGVRQLALGDEVAQSVGLGKAPAILESEAVVAPLSIGFVRPQVVVPRDAVETLSNEQLRGLLTHEFGHIARRDHLVGLLQRLSLVVYWWNPLVRQVGAAISSAREQICDDLATRDAASSDSYASMLVELAQQAIGGRPLPSTIGMFDGSRREFSRRVERLLDESRNVATVLDWRMKFVAAVMAAALVALSGVASIQHESSAAEPEAAPKPAAAKPAQESSDPPAVNWPKELWGVINDEVGRPIAGAKVRLDVEKIHEYKMGRWDETVWSREFTTGKDGVYRFDTAELPKLKHRPFCLMMSATADGFTESKTWNWYSRSDTKVDEHWSDLKLLPGRVVRGRVVDQNGEPVPGAVVKAAGYFGLNSSRAWGWDPRSTDEDGRFSISLPKDENVSVELWVVSRDWAPQRVPVPKKGEELADVRLQPGGRVSGTVTGEDGLPIVGAVVVAESVDDGTLQHMGFSVHLAVKTDHQGRYQLPPIDGIYRVYISQAEETDDRITNRFVVADGPLPIVSPVRVAVSGHQDEQVDFRTGPTLAVRGTVRWADGSPVADCQVQASFMPPGFGGGIWLDDTRTDAEGNYTVTLPKPIDGISINVIGAYDSDRVWHFGNPADNVQAKQKSLQFIGLGDLTADVEGIDWVLKSEDKVEELRPVAPQQDDAATLELKKLERRYNLRQQELQEALAQTNDLEERNQLSLTRDPRILLADDYLALEEKYRRKDAGLAALVKLNQISASVGDLMPKLPEARRELYRRLAKHYITNPDLDVAFNSVSSGPQSPLGPELLQKAIDTSPHRTVQASAIYQLACYQSELADHAEMVPMMIEEAEAKQPRDEGMLIALRQATEKLMGVDSAALRENSIRLAERLKRDYADVREPQRVFNESGIFWRQPETSEQARAKPGYGALADGLLFDLKQLQVGMPAPDIATETDGKQDFATQYLGKVTLLMFDYSFNEHQERSIADWSKQRTGKPLDVLVVRTRLPGEPTEFDTSEFAPLRFIAEDRGGPIATQWSIRRWPTVFVVDGNGVIRARRLNDVPYHLVGELLKGAAAEADRVFVPRTEVTR